MKYLSIDIETTGLDPERHQILQIGAVYDDLENPKPESQLDTFTGIVKWNEYVGQPVALKMNAELLGHPDGVWIADLGHHFRKWMVGLDSGKVTVAGKNFATFDLPFIQRAFPGVSYWFHRRILDVGTMYAVIGDKELPNLSECCLRAGLEEEVTHDALEDALMVVRLVRHYFLAERA